ncbi:hypothetical protein F4678DRAFT_466940 [Xylaria arbuscula]|nr:hypothetical protein F4678DRAFT_466940 [Xylaria arbuscula]
MCTEIYNLFGDIQCQHKEYQNTFPCHVARRCHVGDDHLLNEPVFLPAKPPSVPPGLLGCKVRRATRPVAGTCRDCNRRRKLAAQGNGNHSKTSSMTPSSTSASVNSLESIPSIFVTPPLNPRALAQVQESFLEVSKEQQSTPPSLGPFTRRGT